MIYTLAIHQEERDKGKMHVLIWKNYRDFCVKYIMKLQQSQLKDLHLIKLTLPCNKILRVAVNFEETRCWILVMMHTEKQSHK